MTTAISCLGLVKRFGELRALDGLDLCVESGEIHGFLGPNGAGKTVTLRILLGLLRSDGGHVEVLGRDPWDDAVGLHRSIAYVPGETNLWPQLTGGETLDLLGELHGGVDLARRAQLVQLFDLDLRRRARHYSKGNRQKVALVAALAADTDLLILDEPTSGLDPVMEAIFQEQLRAERASGRTVLLSSHQLSEVEKLCDRVTIVRRGRTVQSGTLDDLRQLHRTTVRAELDDASSLPECLPGVSGLVVDGAHVRCQVDTVGLGPLMHVFAAAGLRSLTCRPPTLEDLFLEHYGDEAPAPEEPTRT